MKPCITVTLRPGQTKEMLEGKLRSFNLVDQGQERAIAGELLSKGVVRSKYLASILNSDFDVAVDGKPLSSSPTPHQAIGKEDPLWTGSNDKRLRRGTGKGATEA